MPRDEGVRLASLLIQIVVRCCRAEHHFTFTALKLPKDLVVPLSTHHYLTVNVLNIHVLSAVPCIGPHQAGLVGDTGLNVIDCGGRSCLLE